MTTRALSGRRARGRRRISIGAALLIVVLATACTDHPDPTPAPTGSAPSPTPSPTPSRSAPERLTVAPSRGGQTTVAQGGRYNYAPSVLLDQDEWRMWWCSQAPSETRAGDDILSGSAPTPDGRFVAAPSTDPTVALSAGPSESFDSLHVCDPTVIAVDGTYYMYFTGADSGNPTRGRNSIGVATSTDGTSWTRANDGRPVAVQSGVVHGSNGYGIGQPSVARLDGWYYLMFTDTTAQGANENGAGQFLLRSRDPLFSRGVEALEPGGFEPTSVPSAPRDRALVNAFSADLAWFAALDAWGVAHQARRGTRITFFSKDFSSEPYEPIYLKGRWTEGPGIARVGQGHIPLDTQDPCGTVPVDIFQSTGQVGTRNAPTDIRHYSTRITGIDACPDTRSTLELLDGAAVPAPGGGYDVVVDGELLRVTRRALARELAVQVLETRPEELTAVPVAARTGPGTRVVRSAGRTGIVPDDGRLWVVPTGTELTGLPVVRVTPQRWSSYEQGPALG